MKKGRCDKHAGCALHVSNICQAGSVSIERFVTTTRVVYYVSIFISSFYILIVLVTT